MEAATDAELRLARRLKLGVRLVVYPLLLVLIGVAWHARQARGAQDDTQPAAAAAPKVANRHWTGRTQPGARVPVSALGWTADGAIWSLGMAITLPCRDGTTFVLRQTLGPEDFATSGSGARAVVDPSHGRADDGGAMTSAATVDVTTAEDRVGVSVDAWVNWTRGDTGRVVRCEADAVRVALTPSA
jgi:hypothetical protein